MKKHAEFYQGTEIYQKESKRNFGTEKMIY